nr:TonB-dependent receptor plug domain-containing protein [Alcaligenes sp. HPC1271]
MNLLAPPARRPIFALGLLATALAASFSAQAQTSNVRGGVTSLEEIRVLPSAEEAVKQAPGVSTITAEDIEKRPPANDLSELIRTMPGVNLTGNSPSGSYGNSRQIDLRGMGPENTLILIDGKPVSSRDSIRMGRDGERNTRGDSNWVPVNAIERIEVLRGPAAARYGSGAAGGVVNIITKAPTDTFSGSVTAYGLIPEDSDYGSTRRTGFNLSGPIADKLSFRVYGNIAKTDADKPALNAKLPAWR